LNGDKIAERLNFSGDFFQRACATKISDRGWDVSEEVSVAWPPKQPNQESRVLDIQAAFFDGQGLNINALVECKRAHPKYKTWIFFPKRFGARDALAISITTALFRTHPAIAAMSKLNPNLVTIRELIGPAILPSLDPKNEFQGYTCSIAREIPLEGDSKISQDRIHEACRQVSIGKTSLQYDTKLMLEQEKLRIIQETLSAIRELPRPPEQRIEKPIATFIPIIVTTADLRIVKFREAEVDIRTGDIDASNLEYVERDWLIYEYPLPGPLQRRSYRQLETMQGREAFRKLQILIVNSMALDTFFEGLKHIQFRSLEDLSEG